MDVFVGNISPNTSVVDLRKFFKGFEKKAVFEVKRMRGKQGKVIFGLISFQSDRMAQKAIKKLHMQKLNGRPVIVREFVYRAGGNDRRQLNWRKKLWLGEERRKSERRDANEEIKNDFDSYAA